MKWGSVHFRTYRTGTISYVHSATSSVLPINYKVESREWGDRTITNIAPGLSMKTWFLYKEAYDMDFFKIIELVSTIQKHVDQGISFEFMMNEGFTTRDLFVYQYFAHQRGIKSIYYTRTKRSSQGVGCVSCAV